MVYNYQPRGVCSRLMTIDVEGDTIKSVEITGGCEGNTKGVSILVAGIKIDDAIKKLRGIDCRGRGTSCPDQLAIALEEIKEKNS